MNKILIVEASESDRRLMSGLLTRAGYEPITVDKMEAYSTSGNEDFFEPALGITHADGNMTTYLYYVNSTQEPVNGGTHNRINLKDDKYPVNVTLNYVAYPKENVIKMWTEISHREKKPVTLSQYASAMLYFNEPQYWLTENPDVAYFKWDCNSPITNIYSPYAKDKQGQLYVDHVRGIYNVLKRIKDKYPDVSMMLCSGEINLMPGTESKFAQNGKTYTGDYLMKVGLDVFTCNHNTSMVVEIVAE